jgi:hypothetical protein
MNHFGVGHLGHDTGRRLFGEGPECGISSLSVDQRVVCLCSGGRLAIGVCTLDCHLGVKDPLVVDLLCGKFNAAFGCLSNVEIERCQYPNSFFTRTRMVTTSSRGVAAGRRSNIKNPMLPPSYVQHGITK